MCVWWGGNTCMCHQHGCRALGLEQALWTKDLADDVRLRMHVQATKDVVEED